MKSIVTGGAGFIGSHTVDLLIKEGHEVIVIDNLVGGRLDNLIHLKNNPNLSIVEKDINNLSGEENILANSDFIFHFAGIGDIVPSIENPYEYMKTNVLGTIRMLEIADMLNVKKFVYAASSSCYGLADTPTDELHKTDLKYPYALSKFQGEQACFHWSKVYGLNVNSIRIFNAYGTRSRTSGAYGAVIGVFLKQKLENKPFTVVGDGNQKRDFVYVTDVAKAFYLAGISKVSGEIFNLGAGNPQSINKLVKLIGGQKIEYIPKRNGEPNVTFADIKKIKKLLNWSPKVDFENGIKLILENISYWEKAPLWNKDSIKEATATWFKYMGE
jgi:UDP-glucose 4-epimerase